MKQSVSMQALTSVEQFVEANKACAYDLGNGDFWRRDKNWIASAQERIASGNSDSLETVLDEMRNLSQSFGAYATDLPQLDLLLDLLHQALEKDVLNSRTH